MRSAGLALAGALCAGMVQVPEQSVQWTAGRWALDTAVDRCTLVRTFASPSDMTLVVTTTPGVSQYRINLRGREIARHASGKRFPVSLQFHQADQRFDAMASSGTRNGGRSAEIDLFGLKENAVEALGRATSFSLVDGGKTVGPFALPGASRATASLRECVNLQLAEWGADPTQFKPGGARPVPIGDPEKMLSNRDLLRLRYEGGFLNALIRLSVGLDGRVEQCVQVDPQKGGNVEEAACKTLLSQRLYTPAHDLAGKPVKGVATTRIILASVPAGFQPR